MKTYVTSREVEIEFRPVSKELMLRFSVANPQPTVPTYEVKSELTGTVEYILLDEKSLREKPEQFTAEHHAAWTAYASQYVDYVRRFVKFFCLRGLKINATISDEWTDEQAALGFPVSESKAERRYEWITSEVLATDDDFMRVIAGVMEASGVNADLQTQVAESFPSNAQRDTAQSIGNTPEQMESITELGRSKDDAQITSDIESMGVVKRTRQGVVTRHARNARSDGGGGNSRKFS